MREEGGYKLEMVHVYTTNYMQMYMNMSMNMYVCVGNVSKWHDNDECQLAQNSCLSFVYCELLPCTMNVQRMHIFKCVCTCMYNVTFNVVVVCGPILGDTLGMPH